MAGDPQATLPAVAAPRGVRPRRAAVPRTWEATARAVLPAFLVSRLVALVAGAGAVAVWGVEPVTRTFDPLGRTTELGGVFNVLVAPFARWDSVWLLDVSAVGYPAGNAARPAFFPLYPVLVRIGSWLVASPLVAGLLISTACAFVGAMVVHRLAERELGPRSASGAVWALCLFPGSLWLTAVYTEGLFLLLSAGCLLAARERRWAPAAILGALAATTRSAGVVLVVPVLVTAWEGWRARGAASPRGPRGPRRPTRALTPHADADTDAAARGFVLRPILAAIVIPLGTLAFVVGLAVAGHPWDAAFDVQALWGRETVGPVSGALAGIGAAGHGARVLLGLAPVPAGASTVGAAVQVALLVTLLVALVALVGAARRLPPAYAAYAGCALLLPLSAPALGQGQPLMSLPRFVGVLFPLAMWGGWWAMRGSAARRRSLAVGSTILLALTAALTARWTFVA